MTNNKELEISYTEKGLETYTEKGFWGKIKKFASVAGKELIKQVLIAYYCANDPDTPMEAKAIIWAALAYFITPLDVISDLIVGIGYTDDIAIVGAALVAIAIHVKGEHREKAQEQLDKIFKND
ncbi:MAG: YkvA family protein [Gammaproteobacteria bacterium]|nr:YkvA family protein [Gammaproteobacteria bacterium]